MNVNWCDAAIATSRTTHAGRPRQTVKILAPEVSLNRNDKASPPFLLQPLLPRVHHVVVAVFPRRRDEKGGSHILSSVCLPSAWSKCFHLTLDLTRFYANERVRLCQLDTLGDLAVLRASASGIQVAEDEDDEPASASSSVVRLCLVAGIW
eukprot:COSAG02_NODE_24_length_52386_cov_726.042898_24_plen_151_part_00